MCQKCQKYTGIFKNRPSVPKILVHFFDIFDIYIQNKPQNWPNMAQKMVKNPKNYTGIFNFLPKMMDYWLSTDCQKCTELFGLLFLR